MSAHSLIQFFEPTRTFFLRSAGSSYVFKISEQGIAVHLYWGPALEPHDLDSQFATGSRAFSPPLADAPSAISLDSLLLEYPVYGTSDFREPALEIYQPKTGSRIVDLRYHSHKIIAGKPALSGLPHTFVSNDNDAETLTLVLKDTLLGLEVELLYTAFASHAVIARSVRITNAGGQTLEIRRALSASADFATTQAGYQFVQLSGAHARERDVVCSPLRPGMQGVDSKRGASSHHHNPFIALAEHGMDETRGDVYAFNLVYSGNWLGQVEVDSIQQPRMQMGLNPFDFNWQLAPGEQFQTPEAVLAYSADGGMGSLSRTLHRFYRNHLQRSLWKDKQRPILINNWEATYFDFDADKLEALADAGVDLGIELFVLDDGWFGRRDSDNSSLGDWVVDKRKLPAGLDDLVRRINAKNMLFGLWFEPEMVSPDSDLYRTHPDWCLHVQDRKRTESRQQLVLDFARRDVRDAIFEAMSRILRSAPIGYVKWDMNRNLTEIGSRGLSAACQQETAHRYMLGVYELAERLTSAFPQILFEGCAGGGGRFDPGMLYYFPQIWTSDNTDAISRLRIQYGTSYAYPPSSMSAHVSAVPNHQLGRVTPLRTRGDTAFFASFGYELDLTRLSATDKDEIRRQIAEFKRHRELLLNGDFYRLMNPFGGNHNECAWAFVAEDRSEALVTHVNVLAEPLPNHRFLRLQGLDANRTYRDTATGIRYQGAVLLHAGLPIPKPWGDFISYQCHLLAE